MAKLKGPLMSLGASQQIGKTLVYFTWKGLNCVREYIIPSNPRTAKQVEQRGFIAAAVAALHAAQGETVSPLAAADVTAYARLANTHATPRTWFNEAVKLWADCEVAGKNGVIYSAFGLVNTTPTELACSVIARANCPIAAAFHYGTSVTALYSSQAATIASAEADWTATTAYGLNEIVKPTSLNLTGYVYKCTAAGTTDAAEPTWPTTLGGTVVDGTVTWTCVLDADATITGTITGLTAGVKYYVQLRPAADGPCVGAVSGIATEYST